MSVTWKVRLYHNLLRCSTSARLTYAHHVPNRASRLLASSTHHGKSSVPCLCYSDADIQICIIASGTLYILLFLTGAF